MNKQLLETFGNIDIYLFDQLLKGRFDDCRKIIDIGCGYGRNLKYFLKNGFEVYGVDKSTDAIEAVKELSQQLSPHHSSNHFSVGLAEDIPFDTSMFDLAISSAVFHFANDHVHFNAMIQSAWRVIKPGGYLFSRLASDIGIEEGIINLGNGRYLLPDGSERYLVNEQILLSLTKELNGELFEPIKTTNVQNLRCMTTWCIQKKFE